MSWCIDTSSLIQARRAYPRRLFPTLWDRLEALISAGRLVAPVEVFRELAVKDDELHKWAKDQDGLFVNLDNQQQNEVSQTVLPTYPATLPQFSLDKAWADPWVIGLARLRSITVVTEEKKDHPAKIPVVCAKLGVQYVNLLGLLEAEDWHF